MLTRAVRRLAGQLIIFPIPWVMTALWFAASKFLPAATVDKVRLIRPQSRFGSGRKKGSDPATADAEQIEVEAVPPALAQHLGQETIQGIARVRAAYTEEMNAARAEAVATNHAPFHVARNPEQ